MAPVSASLEFTEALKDSPRFRNAVWQREQELAVMEAKLREILRLCTTMIEFGKSYVASFCNLMMGVQDLNKSCFTNDPTSQGVFNIVTDAYAEILKFQKVLVEQAHWSIIKNINDFIRRELGKVGEMRNHFQRVSGSLDEALTKKAAIPRQKEADGHEARNELTAVGTCFAHTALDYVFQLNLIHARNSHEILDVFVSFLSACQTYFHQGHDMFADCWEENKLKISESLASLKQNSKREERRMQDRHMLVPKEVFQHPPGMSPDPDVVMEGYLFKRATNAFKAWHRRWFQIRDNRLLYCHRDLDARDSEKPPTNHRLTDDGYTVMEPDLRLCLVRTAPNSVERLCCFELVTPTKSHMLQADSESLCNAWIKALHRSIESAIHDDSMHSGDGTSQESNSDSSSQQVPNSSATVAPETSPPKPRKKRAIDELRDVSGNERCADCDSPNPKWASVNLGIALCIECCGIHRSLGVQVSKVRSLTLDVWEAESLNLMRALGNDVVNGAYLAHYTDLLVPPPAKPNSSRAVREAWIRAKYVEKAFARPAAQRARQVVTQRKGSRRFSQLMVVEPPSDKRASRLHRPKSVCGPWGDAGEDLEANQKQRLRMFLSSPDVRSLVDEDSVFLEASQRKASSVSPACCFGGSDTKLEQYQVPDSSSNKAEEAEAGLSLLRAAAAGDVSAMCKAVACGADVNSVLDVDGKGCSTALHQAITSGSMVASEFLLFNGANLNLVDAAHQTPLHLAVISGHTGQVCQLLKRKALQDLRNREGETPLDIAMLRTHADIVTLLRLAKLKEDSMEDVDLEKIMTETVDGVFKDFSQMAANNPELLQRSSTASSDRSALV